MLCLSGFALYSRWVPLIQERRLFQNPFLRSLKTNTINHLQKLCKTARCLKLQSLALSAEMELSSSVGSE